MDNIEVGFEINPDYFAAQGYTCDNLNDESNHACCKLISNIHKKIRDNIGLGMNVKLYQVDGLPKSEGGKLNRIIDNRHL